MAVQDRTRLTDLLISSFDFKCPRNGYVEFITKREVLILQSSIEASKLHLNSLSLFSRIPLSAFFYHSLLLSALVITRFLGLSAYFPRWLFWFLLAWVQHAALRNLWQQETQKDYEGSNVSSISLWSVAACRNYCHDLKAELLPMAALALIGGLLFAVTFGFANYFLFIIVRFAVDTAQSFRGFFFDDLSKAEAVEISTERILAGFCPKERIIFACSGIALALYPLYRFIGFYLQRLGFLLFRAWSEKKDGMGLIFQPPSLDEAPLRNWKVFDLLILFSSIGGYQYLWFRKYKDFSEHFDEIVDISQYQSSRSAYVTQLSDHAMEHEMHFLLLLSLILTAIALWYYLKCMVYARYLRCRRCTVRPL